MPGQALPRRRSEAVDLPLPPRRRRALRGDRSGASSRKARELLHLRRASAARPSIQSVVNAAFAPLHARRTRRRHRRPRTSRSRRSGRGPDGRSPTIVALPGAAPLLGDYGQGRRVEDRGVAPRRGRRVRRLARHARAAGRSPSASATRRCRSRRATSASSSSASRASATTSRAPYVRALEARRIPHVLVGGRSSTSARRSSRCATRSPPSSGPTTSSASTRRCAARSSRSRDDALLAFRQHAAARSTRSREARRATLDRARRDARRRRARRSCATLHRGRNRRPIADTIAALLEATRAHAGVAIWPTGEQALAQHPPRARHRAPLRGRGRDAFRAFVRRLEDDAERGGGAEAPVVEEGTDGVRIMTVHKAKGLEFPGRHPRRSDRARSRRTSRRATSTRSKKLWAMPLCGCTPIELLERRDEILRHDARRPCASLRRDDARARSARRPRRRRRTRPIPAVARAARSRRSIRGPKIGARLTRLPAARRSATTPCSSARRTRSATNEAPCARTARAASGHAHGGVVGSARAQLRDEQDAGQRQQRILAVDEASGHDAESEREHDAWQKKRAEGIERGGAPTHRVEIVTARSKLGGAVSLAARSRSTKRT